MQCPIVPSHPPIEESPHPADTVMNLIDHITSYDRDFLEQRIHALIDEILPAPVPGKGP